MLIVLEVIGTVFHSQRKLPSISTDLTWREYLPNVFRTGQVGISCICIQKQQKWTGRHMQQQQRWTGGFIMHWYIQKQQRWTGGFIMHQYTIAAEVDRWVYYSLIYKSSRGGQVGLLYIDMSLCQKVLGEDHPFWGPKCIFRFKFSLNKPNFIWKSMHQRDNKDKLDSQSQFWVSKIWKFTPSPGRKSAKEGWTFRVHRFSCRFVCIFLL